MRVLSNIEAEQRPMRTDCGSNSSLNLGLLLLLGLLWGMPYALTKISLATMPPLTLVAARASLAAAALWIVVAITGRKRPLRRNSIPSLFIQGCVGCSIPYALIAYGQQTVDSALTGILN
jgi:drug/metabolite transporter (DMT)-like permease